MNIFRLFRTQFQWRLIAFVAPLVVLPLLVVSFVLLNQWRAAVTDGLDGLESTHIIQEANQIRLFVGNSEADIRILGGLPSVQNLARAIVNGDEELIASATRAVEADFLNLSLNRGVYLKIRYIAPDGTELVVIDFDGTNVTINRNLQDKSNREYYTAAVGLPDGQIYISPLNLNREGTEDTIEGTITDGTAIPVVRYAIPVYASVATEFGLTGERQLGGIVVTSLFMEPMFDSIDASAEGATVTLIDQDGYYLYHNTDPTRVFGFEPEIAQIGGIEGANIRQEFTTSQIDLLFAETEAGEEAHTDFVTENETLIHFERIEPPGAPAGYYWLLINERDQSTLLAPVNEATLQTYAGLAVLLAVASVLAIIFARQIVFPIRQLQRAANRFAGGDLELRESDDIKRDDELGILSRALNAMATQLRGLIGSFEERLEERTRDLQTVVAVSNQISTILDVNRLLQDVVDLTKERFGLYHAHVYILNEQTNILRLTAGAGHVGRQMVSEDRTIELYNVQSIVARAARSRTTVIINNVRESETFLPHPLLPDTHAELAVPLIARGRVLGVLDVQSDEAGYFTDETESVLNILATQIATALSNAQLFETADRASRHEQAIGRIQSQIQTALDMEEVLQVTVRELGKALRVPHTAIELRLSGDNNTQTSDKLESIDTETPVPTGETHD